MKNRKEYNRRYYQEHKEKFNESTKKWYSEHPEKRKEYYEKNKEKIKLQNKRWQEKNKKRFIELCNKSRTKRVARLREQGCSNPWSVVNNGQEPKYKGKE